MRIGLTQRVEVVSGYGERRDCLDQRWADLLWGLGFVPVPLCNAVAAVDSYLERLHLDGVVLTGGNDLMGLDGADNVAPERDVFEHRLLEVAGAADMPVLGVCRGLQLIASHFGSRLESVDHHVGVRHTIESPAGEREVNSFHRYGVRGEGLGEALEPLARAGDGTVESLRHCALPLWAIMWHPEREESLADSDRQLLLRVFGQS